MIFLCILIKKKLILGSMQTSLLGIVGNLAGGVSVAVAIGVTQM